jgi:hypothetical protein
MRIAKLINRRIRHTGKAVQVAGDVNAAVAANVGERGGFTRVSSVQRSTSSQSSAKEARDG